MAAQILATIIFLIMFGFIITEKAPRHLVTLVCAAATLLLVFGVCMRSVSAVWETLNLECFLHGSFWYSAEASESGGINWETIVFLAGMMIMVEGMADSGFFQWLCITIAKAVHYRPFPIFLTFMLLSAALSMFIDSITVILFLSTVTIELGQLLKFDPVPAILAEVFCANLGGSATMCGDPPNIIIGTSLGYSFGDFITHTGLIAGICLLLVIPYFCLCFHKEFKSAPVQELNLDPKDAINDPKEFFGSCAIFLAAVLLLSTHAQTGLTVSAIGVLIAVVTLLAFRKRAVAILRQIDHNTLIFFIGLFVVISGLQRSGVLDLLAQGIGTVSGSNVHLMIAIILFGSAVASAFIDNIPFAATMIPVIQSLSALQGVHLDTLAWTLSIGTDVGGSATPIGASANVVALSQCGKNGISIGWGRYCKVMAPATLLVIAVSLGILYLRYL